MIYWCVLKHCRSTLNHLQQVFNRLQEAKLALKPKKCSFLQGNIHCRSTLNHLQQVFNRLQEAKLALKPKKCSFLQGQVIYLGHVISRKGTVPDPSKTQNVKDFPVPTDVTKLKQFLGLASYYRRFIPGSRSLLIHYTR